MSDLSDLYQEVVVEHARSPRNAGVLEGEGVLRADGDNPLCGDRITVMLEIDAEERIREIRFTGDGCAISTASASLMTEAVTGLGVADALALFARFREVMTTDADPGATSADVLNTAARDATVVDGADVGHAGVESADPDSVPPLGMLEALVGVRAYPMRVKCATLAWHTLRAALPDEPAAVAPTTRTVPVSGRAADSVPVVSTE